MPISPAQFIPERLAALPTIAANLSWSWSRDGRALFALIDPVLWAATRENPIALLGRTDPARLAAAALDPRVLALYDREAARVANPDTDNWFHANFPDVGADRPVAYFCAEFAVHSSVPVYSGGLGVLAGDHCKSASDLGIPFVAIGLGYTGGYFEQHIRADGWQEDSDQITDPADSPLEPVLAPGGGRALATVRMFGRDIAIGASRLRVGHVDVYLLTTELDENHPDDRGVTRKLYGGDNDLRLRQEWILGVGGVRVLRSLGIDPGAWHANEGHAAFMMLERVRELMVAGTSAADAVEQVRARGIFTTHTPVPAGHDAFAEDTVAACAGPLWEEMGVTREGLLAVGRHPSQPDGRFHMTALAIRLSGRINGVAQRHGEVSREIWHAFWPTLPVAAVPIGAVTNGVHLATWMSDDVKRLLDVPLGSEWELRRDDLAVWDSVHDIDDAALWATHAMLKRRLATMLREQARRRWIAAQGADPANRAAAAAGVAGAGTLLDPELLTIGFARRFATYKRADLLFHDLDRLRALVTDPRRPMQVVFAGKAHPADSGGKKILQTVYEFAQDPSLMGRIAFVEGYDLGVAGPLVQGVDVWMNVPRVPLEASGTSGMKAALNGVPQLSTLDGWWPEAYDGRNGWAIPAAAAVSAHGDQTALERAVDDADERNLYDLLEREVVPLYYERDSTGLPRKWIDGMKHAIAIAGRYFTTRRMLQDYARDYYAPAMRAERPAHDAPTP